jgi:hypothetical protein
MVLIFLLLLFSWGFGQDSLYSPLNNDNLWNSIDEKVTAAMDAKQQSQMANQKSSITVEKFKKKTKKNILLRFIKQMKKIREKFSLTPKKKLLTIGIAIIFTIGFKIYQQFQRKKENQKLLHHYIVSLA